MKKIFTLLTVLAISITTYAKESRVIYGEDNRADIYEVSGVWQAKAHSTVALMNSSSLTDLNNGFYKIKSENYGERYGLCQEEPFRDQPSAAFCSGSLIAPNIILTAGHCITSDYSCASARFVFGFGYTESNTDLSTAPYDNVYACKKILSRLQEYSGADFAIIELDRNVVGRDPLPFRKSGTISKGEPLVVIGHPAGIPTKVANGASVRNVFNGYFNANLDTYGGNSGSAVFNERTGLIEGILVRGTQDFVYQNSCRISNVCTDGGCYGEDVTRVDVAVNSYPINY